MTQKSKSFVRGVGILGISGIICKVIGVLFRIPLTWIIGLRGVKLYQLVFPTYSLFLTLSSAGIPVAISRMVSHYLTKQDPANAKRVFKSAITMLTILGFVSTIIVLLLKDVFVERVGVADTAWGFIAIAPSLLLVCIMSAFRGFIQGQQNMAPTAISQLIEQVGKVVIALPLAALGMQYGNQISEAQGFAMGATGALIGTTLSELVALCYTALKYRKNKTYIATLPQDSTQKLVPMKVLSKKLLFIAVPITLGACIVPLASFIDSAMLVNLLEGIGYTNEVASDLYGLLSGYVITIINIPTALALAVAMSLVPAISSALAKKNYGEVSRQSSTGLRFAFIIGFPCSLGMSILSSEIIQFFYGSSISPAEAEIAASLLSVSALTVLFFTVVQATSSILQGLGKQRIPMYTLMAGVACKVALNYTLVQIPSINIHGAPFASLACYIVSMIPNLYYVMKYAKMKFDWQSWVLRPGLAALGMSVAVWIFQRVLPKGMITTVILVMIGVVVFALLALALNVITPSDLRAFNIKIKPRYQGKHFKKKPSNQRKIGKHG